VTDGRRLRGERRRAALLEAVLTIVERDGVAGVTHRAVAAEAGVSLASTTYHFATLDDLLVAALTESCAELTADLTARLEHRSTDPVDTLYELLEQCLGERRGRTLAEYELYLLAARRPALRPAAAAWLDPLTAFAEQLTGDPARAMLMVATLDGLLLEALIGARTINRNDLRALLTQT
jgi:DNA-binding transcriptional regulator YbjK